MTWIHWIKDDLLKRGQSGQAFWKFLNAWQQSEDKVLESMPYPLEILEPCLEIRAFEKGFKAKTLKFGKDLSALAREIIVIGDVHGHWKKVKAMLVAQGIIDEDLNWLASPQTWLVQMGDLIDMGLPWSPTGPPEQWIRDLEALHRRGALQSLETLNFFHTLFERSNGHVQILMGNHELDLLSKRFLWVKGQKLYLEAFLEERPGLKTWLEHLPLYIKWHEFFFIHGGPTPTLNRELSRHKIDGLLKLDQWLERQLKGEQRDSEYWTQDFFQEGKSWFSPPQDWDAWIWDKYALLPILLASQTKVLVVGHSPFYGLASGFWYNVQNPKVKAHVQNIQRLGPWGQVIKTDVDLKRGGDLKFLLIQEENLWASDGVFVKSLKRDDEIKGVGIDPHLLSAFQKCLERFDAWRSPELVDLREIGIESQTFERFWTLRERTETVLSRALRSEFNRWMGFFLQSSPFDMEQVLDDWASWMEEYGPKQAWFMFKRELSELKEVFQALAFEWIRKIDDQKSFQTVVLDFHATLFKGRRYRGLTPVLKIFWEHLGEEKALEYLGVLEWIAHRDRPAIRIQVVSRGASAGQESWIETMPVGLKSWNDFEAWGRAFLKDFEHQWSPEFSNHLGSIEVQNPEQVLEREVDRGGSSDPAIEVEKIEAWLRHHEEKWPLLWGPWIERYREGEAILEWTENQAGDLMIVDLSLKDPKLPWDVMNCSGDFEGHQEYLLRVWDPGGTIVLYSSLKRPVFQALERNALGALRGFGSMLEGKPKWRSGIYLFTTPILKVALDFQATNPYLMRIEWPRALLEGMMAKGWVNVQLMKGHFGQIWYDEGRSPWGSEHIALEVIAIGTDGVRLFYQKAERISQVHE